MKRDAPRLDTRRAEEFRGELLTRARSWIRDWALDESTGDFGAALIDVASRFSAQVAERLDRASDKLSLGLLDWLAVRGSAARPARMPVAFKLADSARDTVLAPRGTRLQTDVDGASVTFETEEPVNLVPGTLAQLVAVDTGTDAYFLPPPGLTSLDPLEPLPNRWTLKNFADQGAVKLQMDPALGLGVGTLIEFAGHQYGVVKADGDLVEIEPGVQSAGGLAQGTEAKRVVTFRPFDGTAQNHQEHIVYLGDKDLFNIEAAATFEILGTNNKLGGATWQYFGKSSTEDLAKWRDLAIAPEEEQQPGALKLLKPAGSVEPTDLGNIKGARWIRARQTQVADENGVLLTDELSVIVNRGKNLADCPPPGVNADAGAPAEGFINSTALVLGSVFYPLGKQPKQFDTFYLGCIDAFSKKKAEVSICFEMADPAPASFAAVLTGAAADRALVSAGADGALHVFGVDPNSGALSEFRGRGPLQPKGDAGAVTLDPKPGYRLPVWTNDNNPKVANPFAFFFPGGLGRSSFSVAVSAGNAVWVWLEAYFWPLSSQWISYNAIARTSAPANAKIDALAYLPGPGAADAELYAAFGGKLFRHSALEDRANENWSEVTLTGDFTADDKVRSISPVYVLDGALPAAARSSGLVAVLEHVDGTFGVYIIELLEDAQHRGVCVEVESPTTVVAATQPTAGRIGNDYFVFWHRNDPVAPAMPPPAQIRSGRITRTLVVNGPSTWGAVTGSTDEPSDDPDAVVVGGSFDIQKIDGNAALIVVTRNSDQGTLTSLAPFAPATSTASFKAPLPAGIGPLAGAATVFGHFIVAPGAQSDAWLGAWDPGSRASISVTVETGIIVPTASQPLAVGDYIAIATSLTAQEHTTIDDLGTQSGDERLYTLHSDIGVGLAGSQPPLLAFRVVSANGTTPNPGNKVYASGAVTAGGMKLEATDRVVQQGEWLLIQDAVNGLLFRQVDVVTTAVGAWSVTFIQTTGLAATASVAYWHPDTLPGRIAPFFRLDPGGNGNWNAARLDQANLVFENPADPPQQRGKAFRVDGFNRPEIVVLASRWNVLPPDPADFYIDSSITSWQHQLGDNTSNPELAWEYWNGTNWTQLNLDADATLNLKQTGRLDFKVPLNLAATDVAGKTNYWVRARLVGGDYGQEKIKVVTKPVGTDGTTEQTVERSPADIRPPLVVRMRVRYALSTEVLPAYLVTQDSGSQRNQSDANRTPGALVEGFVPLSLLMKRLAPAGADTALPSAASAGPSSCSCVPAAQMTTAVPPAAKATGEGKPTPNDTRSILLGFDGGLSGEPVNVLLLAEERPHDGFAPLTVEALNRDRFEVLTVKDTTRALGESGLLSMSLPVKPSPRDLFGNTRSWLRLHPSRLDPNGDWRPVIRGAYLNAAWAKATETLTREPLGSSDGRPQLTLNVARPPLLANTLELRVKEPLDEEERKALIEADEPVDPDHAVVKLDLPDLPGDWVLWCQVPDPADYGPQDRVYSLDESSGEVQFGDGIHGMIPPIGRDSVVAFRYQRTEPAADGSDAVPANAVEARASLNLVTPVESVEAAFSAEHAAGGSPPENAARVLLFGTANLRHRGRAIVPRDFEDLARASSPDIAQARAFRVSGGLRVVVVMAGDEPKPTAVQRRALHRLLLESAAPLFGEKSALTVDAPRVRRMRVHLALQVTSLDGAGETALDVKEALQRFFDAVHGGIDGEGWPLGAAPAEDDIAFALAEARGLESIAKISLSEIDDDGSELAWRPTVRRDELVKLDVDAVRIDFETLEIEA